MAVTVINPPPTYEKIVDANGNVTTAWLLFFDQMYNGDRGSSWTPVATNLTQVGGNATLTGQIYRISNKLYFFRIGITPVTNTSSVAGTTYFTGLPISAGYDGFCTAQSSTLGDPTGMIVASNNRIYTPAWTTIAVPVTITGVVETA